VKSGYGLDLRTELSQLEAIRRVSATGGPTLVATFLGAHEVPPESRDDPDAYVDLVIDEMLPAVQEQGIARYCDVFCEPGVFTTDQSRRLLLAAKERGFELKLHADELDGSGGAELAVELGAASADHLAAISPGGIEAIAASDTVAVLLPGTMMFLGGTRQAPARRLIDQGAAVALATDFNPGSSPGVSLPLMMTLAVSQLGMTPAEAFSGITVNGAAAVGKAGTIGSIDVGKIGDVVVLEFPSYEYMPYHIGVSSVEKVIKRGTLVFDKMRERKRAY